MTTATTTTKRKKVASIVLTCGMIVLLIEILFPVHTTNIVQDHFLLVQNYFLLFATGLTLLIIIFYKPKQKGVGMDCKKIKKLTVKEYKELDRNNQLKPLIDHCQVCNLCHKIFLTIVKKAGE